MNRRLGQRRRFMSTPAAQQARHAQRDREAIVGRHIRAERAADYLRGALVPCSHYLPPDVPGLYGLWVSADGWADLNLGPCPDPKGAWLYMGSSEHLASSVLRQHLSDGETRHSGFRRTLAALMVDLYEWEVIPANLARPDSYWHFVLHERDEFSLDCWIAAYVHVADLTWPVGQRSREELETLERSVAGLLRPALNRTAGPTPWSDEVRARRRRCTRLAREWARWRGLEPGSSSWAHSLDT